MEPITKKNLIIAFVITLVYLLIRLIIIGDYALSWDYHYHHYAGLYHLGLPLPDDSNKIPFSTPDPRLTIEDPFGPFTQILPSLSQVILHDRSKFLPADIAFNLPMNIFGSLGVGLTYLFLSTYISSSAGLIGAVFLGLLPVYFGYTANNMKDIPNAAAFTLAIFTIVNLVNFPKKLNLLLAIASFAFAFNVKINSILIPIVALLWVFSLIAIGKIKLLSLNKLLILYFLLAPLAAIALWWPFWRDPLAKLLELPEFYSQNTLNIPVLFLGKMYRSGVDIPPLYPYIYLVITTPLPILLSFVLGLIICLKKIISKDKLSLLLIIWFFIPLARYLSPKSGAIDGVRHFLEVVYPLAFIAAIGWFSLTRWLIKNINYKLAVVLNLVIFSSLILDIIKFHPYQTSYFNSLIGGINGAQGKFDIDFWGTPQKEAIGWLNKNSPKNAYVHVVMAQTTASLYLRDDLLINLNSKSIVDSDYVVILNRQSFFAIYNLSDYLIEKLPQKVVYSRRIDNIPLVWVIKNK